MSFSPPKSLNAALGNRPAPSTRFLVRDEVVKEVATLLRSSRLVTFTGVSDGVSDLQVLWEDGERVFCRGWRGVSDGSRSAVLIVLPAAEHPPRAILDRLAHEHGLKEELDGAWAVRPLEIVRDGGRTMLVLEDVGGFEPLERLLGAPWRSGASCASPSASPWLWASCTSAVLSIRTSSRPTFW